MTDTPAEPTSDNEGSAASDNEGSAAQPLGRRRRLAPPAHPFFQWVFPVLVAIAGVVVVLLWIDGTKAVLETTDGELIAPVTDPDAPSFIAFAEPTPTLLVAHTDADDALVGVTLLARTALDEGGTLVVFSPDMLVELPSGQNGILKQVYVADGAEGLEELLGEFMGFGFTEDPMVINPERLAEFLRLVDPIPFVLQDDLVTVADDGVVEIVVASGGREFDGDTLASVFTWRNESEVDAARFNRQLLIWEAWLGEVAVAEDLLAATLPFDDQLPPFLRSLGTGTADLELVPMTPASFDPDNPIYVLIDDLESWPSDTAREMVPLPIAHTPGARPTVTLLDGTGDATNRDERMLPIVVEAGAEIRIIGNADTFDVLDTTVAYHLPEDEAAGRALADALGVELVFVDLPAEPVDLTVTIGING
ncbi:MAG: hypothetical protein ACI9MX_004101 [Candidatus Aldehydirespiratoraceae bacterium]|jgi:hypothetical protein